MVQNYGDYIRSAYKNLDQPDFSFIRRTFLNRPYDPLIRKLRDFAAVEDLGAVEDDVCFSYLLKGQNALWRLELSMVGPFAIFVRLSNRVQDSDFIAPHLTDLSGFEVKIVEKLKIYGIRLLTPRELTQSVALSLYNTPRAQTCLYQALFSDLPQLPWVQGADDTATSPSHRPAHDSSAAASGI